MSELCPYHWSTQTEEILELVMNVSLGCDVGMGLMLAAMEFFAKLGPDPF